MACKFKFLLGAIGLSLAASGYAIYELFFTPGQDQIGMTIGVDLWGTSPPLLPLLEIFSGSTWPGTIVFSSLLIASNAAIYALGGYILFKILDRIRRTDRRSSLTH